MTKPTQQLADELARKCAVQILSGLPQQSLQQHIEQTIPLPDLIEIAKAAKYSTPSMLFPDVPALNRFKDALTNLQKKVEL